MENPAVVLPNLPHFKLNQPKRRGRTDDFKLNNGVPYFAEKTNTAAALNELRRKSASTSLQVGSYQKPARNAGRFVCQFDGYFKEGVDESPLENHRVRKCRIYFYEEDGSIQVSELRQENSGMPQGTFIKRHRVTKDEDGTVYTLRDLQVGGFITLYGRTFHIIDCNATTRAFLQDQMGMEVGSALPFPTDQYNEHRAAFMARSTGGDTTVDHKIKKNDMKNFAEAALGRTVDNSKREGFLKHDRNVLRFEAVWDDRNSMYGDMQTFRVHYFLADDTMEVLANYTPNCGRDPFPLVLKRMKLPKNMTQPQAGFYHWHELYLGGELMVYKRKLVLTSADGHTREFYEQQGAPLGDPVDVEQEEEVSVQRIIPPHTGFGSEEDSLLSCTGSLMPSPPRRKRGENVLLRFMAMLDSGAPEDAEREFIITFYGEDNSIFVREPPRRNSGILGGTFLSRSKVRDRQTNEFITMHYFYVGNTVDLNGHKMIIMEADTPTLDSMEARPDIFPNSDKNLVIGTFRDRFATAQGTLKDLEDAFRANDPDDTGFINKAVAEVILDDLGSPDLCGQRIITLSRAVGGDQGVLPYKAMLEALTSESYDGYK